ncbi:MAG: bifunctional phosphoribosylaminoimidazolecarboxamide formyltransferase/IMP cyclohydrolase [Pelagibacteraceae bacterium]|nr:bifunctional phosphoribosylaminoimidazolecarboxamide formyltransferase/IMP cyclohydrolase [Pelagibacteraceae bacterium]MBO6466960.1 bifunctional phosphoribosylaminoimidazolecarboxamide formyltransferase/IMP cyclohydrolase [Pelagibacteraceae bacterium]MBO6468273.1 bifunctional phosphoribosylaminoimidazolecarboxamide formyltransferase/IMP cyclohydrolase [Pelagibacteraceae bacterium]MBO6469812.1 bifunctional phosphoribosylaminoimidazolecarboxamide formyltransferase/IMP cyclohydrolase [Pelagibact|tara:strand:- start:779 stop:2302 length:1524 start_codon:yes stop_codon:yes gene_type:complete
MMKEKFALISVYNKNGLKNLCSSFFNNNIKIISTGSTAKHILSLGFPCKSVSNVTKFKEILDGRVKTLHPNIHASLLFNRKIIEHIKSFNKLKFPVIDFLIVNLYPFEKTIKKTSDFSKCIEMIDIGGPALLRSSSKNHEYVTTICDIKDYKSFINELNSNLGSTTLDFRKKMARKAYTTTAKYDLAISNWLDKNKSRYFKIRNHKKISLRYGENPYQKSFFYKNKSKKTFFDNVLQGKKISYNNILDIDSAINCLNEFKEPTCIIVKHNNPCGASSCKRILSAYKKARLADPISAFGGIVALNRLVTLNLAKQISNHFYEIVIANDFTKPALKIFSKKKKLIIIKIKNLLIDKKQDIKSINGGYIFQDKNLTKINFNSIYCVSNKKASKKTIEDLIFSLRVCKHVKSNSIVLTKNKQTIGIGAGQMSRVDATKLSLMKASNHTKKVGFVAASDAFFPFTDNLKLLIKNNCKSIIQPRGSINDNKTIKYANSYGLPLYFSNYRFFKH